MAEYLWRLLSVVETIEHSKVMMNCYEKDSVRDLKHTGVEVVR